MPVYQFLDTRTGKTVDMWLPVERRDDVPAYLKRITVPERISLFGTSSDAKEPGVAHTTVPKAFRDYELAGNDVRKIEKETGFSREHIRRIWSFLWLLFCWLVFSANAADLTPGYSFLLNDTVTAAKLNSLVGSASINQSFLHGQTLAAPGSSDEFLFWLSPSGPYRRTSLSLLLLSNTNLIAAQVTTTTPSPTNTLLLLDTSYNGFKQVALGVIYTNAYAFGSTNVSANVFSNQFQVTVTNLPVATNNGSEIAIVLDSTNGISKQVLLTNAIQRYLDTNYATFFVSTNALMATNATFTAATLMNVAHNLASTPRLVRAVGVCTNPVAGYTNNDEVLLSDFFLFGDGSHFFVTGANSTNVFVVRRASANATVGLLNRSTGQFAVADATNWNIRVYARP